MTEQDMFNELRAILKIFKYRHNNIVEIFKVGRQPNVSGFYIDMEYCHGTLDEYNGERRKESSRQLQWKDAQSSFSIESFLIQIFLDIANGLEFIHELNEVHRDLKPGNSKKNPHF